MHRGKGVNLETDNSLGGSRLGEPLAFLQRRARLLFGDGEQTSMNLAEPSRLENCNERLRLSDCHRGTALARQPLKLSAGSFTATKGNPEQSMLEVLGCCLSLRLLCGDVGGLGPVRVGASSTKDNVLPAATVSLTATQRAWNPHESPKTSQTCDLSLVLTS